MSEKRSIPMASAELNEQDIQAVVDTMRTGRLALGPKTRQFEALIAEYAGVKHGVAVNSGTSGLHLLVRSLGIGPGDDVLVPSFTFAASVNAILYEGAQPVFVDIEDQTYNLDPVDLECKITPHTKAIMAVDVFGHPADWDAILDIAERHDLRVIDDSCEALGAEYKGRRLGGMGNASVFAFYPNKQMTTGEGGIIVTDNDEIASLCRSMRNQGRDAMGAWLEHVRVGYNYRLNEMSAALGVSQFSRLHSFLEKRARVAQWYTERIQAIDQVSPPIVKPNVKMSWFVYVVTLAQGLNRDRVMGYLTQNGIPCRGYFSPIHTQPYINAIYGDLSGSLPVTESIAQRTIALPFHNNMAERDVDYVAGILRKAVTSYSK